MKFGEKILEYKDAMEADLARLVAVPSVCGPAEPGRPFGAQSARALETILNIAGDMGLETKNVGNYAGHAEYGPGGEGAAVVTHVDVVPAGDGWATEPFALTRRNGLLYGRGAADDKGAAVVALYCLKALKDAGVPAKRRVRAIFGAGEEIASDDLEQYFRREPLPVMAFTPDSEYGVCNREKGILRLNLRGKAEGAVREFSAGSVLNAVPASARAVLRCPEIRASALESAAKKAGAAFRFERTPESAVLSAKGKASHAMQPQKGVNAAALLLRLLAGVFPPEELGAFFAFLARSVGAETDGASLGVRRSDAPSGPLTLNLGIVKADGAGALAGLDIRYPVTASGSEIFGTIRGRAAQAGLEAELLQDTAPLYLPEDSALIRLLRESYRAVTGEDAELYSTGGGTYARAIPGRAVAFGPFFPGEPDRRLHNANENIDPGRFLIHAQICLEAVYRMATAES